VKEEIIKSKTYNHKEGDELHKEISNGILSTIEQYDAIGEIYSQNVFLKKKKSIFVGQKQKP
jgi:HD superfamily phosphodiesterase